MMNVKKELLNREKNALRVLATVYGFDFQQPHKIARYNGAWTFKKITAAAELKGNEKIVLLIEDGTDRSHIKYLYMVEITADNVNIEKRSCDGGIFETCISNYWNKAAYHEARKHPQSFCYIVAQDLEHLRSVERAPYPRRAKNSAQRFELLEAKKTGFYDRSGFYYSALKLREAYNGGAVISYTFNRRVNELLFDKSGYILDFYQQQLKSRLANYKYNKRRDEVQRADFTSKAAALDAELQRLQLDTVEVLRNARGYSGIYDAASKARELAWIALKVERYTQAAQKKDFRSVEAAAQKYADIFDEMEAFKNEKK